MYRVHSAVPLRSVRVRTLVCRAGILVRGDAGAGTRVLGIGRTALWGEVGRLVSILRRLERTGGNERVVLRCDHLPVATACWGVSAT